MKARDSVMLLAICFVGSCDLFGTAGANLALGRYDLVRVENQDIPAVVARAADGEPTVLEGGTLVIERDGRFEEQRLIRVGSGDVEELRFVGHWHEADQVVQLKSDDGYYEHVLALGDGGTLTTISSTLPGAARLLRLVYRRRTN